MALAYITFLATRSQPIQYQFSILLCIKKNSVCLLIKKKNSVCLAKKKKKNSVYYFCRTASSWHCSKEAKRTKNCIIVIILFKLSGEQGQVTKKEHEPWKHTHIFVLLFLFFSWLPRCKSKITSLNAF